MITLQDRLSIEKIVSDQLKEKFDEQFKLLPSKQEFFSKMDELMGEIKAVRMSF